MKKREKSNNVLKLLIMIFAITILVARVGSVRGIGNGGGSANSPVEPISQPVTIASAHPTDVSAFFTPEISSTITQRDFEVYIGRISTNKLGLAIGTPDDTIKWRVTITSPESLTADMLDLDEVGFIDPPETTSNIATYHYPFQSQPDGSLVALGSCDATDVHENDCATLFGFSLDENDEFTNADRIKFDNDAPSGDYTIKYELVDTTDDTVLSNAYQVLVTLVDVEGPKITGVTNDPVFPSCSNNPVTVTATITDETGVDFFDVLNKEGEVIGQAPAVKLTYKFMNAISSPGVTIPMDSVDGDEYMAEILLPTLKPERDDGLEVLFKIEANDTLGNSRDSDFVYDYTYDCLAPTANANGPYEGDEGLPVNFDSSSSSDSATEIESYLWDFGDGETSPEQNSTHVYDDNRNYTVMLTVTDSAGNQDTDSTYALISNVAPTANANGDYECDEGDTIQLSGSGDDVPADLPLTFEWDLDNNGVFETPGQNVDYECMDDDIVYVSLRVSDESDSSTDTTTVTVINVNPIANANGEYFGNEGTEIQFTGSATDQGQKDTIVSWHWDFGDGSTSPEQNPTHTYVQDGVYTVTLTVTDDDDGQDTNETTAIIGNVAPTVGDITLVPNPGEEGMEISLTATFSNPGVEDVHTAKIDWGDSTVEDGLVDEELGTVTGTHTYEDEGSGEYEVTVTISDGVDSGSNSALLTINNADPVIEELFVSDSTEGSLATLTASFSDKGTVDTHKCTINWGDGTLTPEVECTLDELTGTVSGTHVYAGNGSYTVTLTVTDDDVGQDTDETTATISDGVPTASFTEDPINPEEGQPVKFTDTSTSPADDIKEWLWDFGDKDITTEHTSTEQNPTHIYLDDGTYNVSLTVTDEDGSTNTKWELKVVMNAVPVVTPTQDKTTDEGSNLSLTVATFKDDGKLDKHRARIDWGDGTEEIIGLVDESDGLGTISGWHVYVNNKEGGYTVKVGVFDESDEGTATFNVNVNNVAPTVLAAAAQTVAKENVVNISTEFTDPGVLDTHTAKIEWGDGSITDALVTEPNSPAGTVSGSHIYKNGGTFTVTITVSDESDSGSNTSIAKVGDFVISLKPGWNLFSVPKVLENNGLATLTSDLDDSISIILTYKDGQWIQPATVEPLKAYWINMEQPGKLLLRFKDTSCTGDTCPVPDARQLNAGWELIGYTDTKPLRSTLALKSIEGGYSQWFGFVNSVWISHIFTQFPDINMEPGLGYWIFMTQPKTLAVLSF